MKIIATIIATNLFANSLFVLFLSFLKNQKQQSGFQQIDDLVTRNISVYLFIASRALIQSHSELNRRL